MAEGVFALWAKKRPYYAVLAHFWCPVVEGPLVKALIHCKLENLKKLIESLLFAEHTMITGQGFHKSLGWLLYSWSTLTFV